MSLTHLSRRHRSALVAWLVTALGVPLGAFVPAAEANNVHVAHTLFGVHDRSLLSHGQINDGSVRLWDVGTQWRDVETSPGVSTGPASTRSSPRRRPRTRTSRWWWR